MTTRKCPGQDTRNWTVNDIYEVSCPHCGFQVEYFKDDLKRACPQCGKCVVNPKNDMACAAWCKSATECLEQISQITTEGQSVETTL